MVLGEFQATSLFYPVSRVESHPWDFYDTRGTHAVDMPAAASAATRADRVERNPGDEWNLSVLQKSVNGSEAPVTIMIYGHPRPSIASILNMKLSCQHSFIASYDAACIWPQLNYRKRLRIFESVMPRKAFPASRAVVSESVSGMTIEQSRLSSDSIRIRTTSDSSVDVL